MHIAAAIAEKGLHRLLNQLCKTVPGIELACSSLAGQELISSDRPAIIYESSDSIQAAVGIAGAAAGAVLGGGQNAGANAAAGAAGAAPVLKPMLLLQPLQQHF